MAIYLQVDCISYISPFFSKMEDKRNRKKESFLWVVLVHHGREGIDNESRRVHSNSDARRLFTLSLTQQGEMDACWCSAHIHVGSFILGMGPHPMG